MKKMLSFFLAAILSLSLAAGALADGELTPEKAAELQEKIEANRALPEH